DSVGLQERLAALPLKGLPLRQATLVHWNDHQVPFVEAQTDHDLAVTLGVVHVHLRWAQLELMRHVARGRLSELIGPFGIRLDRVLRTLDFTGSFSFRARHDDAMWTARSAMRPAGW
ncbi:MAG: penicillin acylase family protein, partial [Acetobacteraceae bacterium]|nr:penicillin acylase family protein [Acetobacteraceae bacterium]